MSLRGASRQLHAVARSAYWKLRCSGLAKESVGSSEPSSGPSARCSACSSATSGIRARAERAAAPCARSAGCSSRRRSRSWAKSRRSTAASPRTKCSVARRIMHGMRLTDEQVQYAIEHFTRGKSADYPLESRLAALAEQVGGRGDLARAFVQIQLQAAVGAGERRRGQASGAVARRERARREPRGARAARGDRARRAGEGRRSRRRRRR